ncbi:hypothetical protein PIB30_086066 [Stylosanthes scabra]|uniref:Serine/threonine-protein phosphatase 7 long form-like n=1 Tax=Stylosanthes scabra TaxID=79078 RepID=A0ABU6XUU2_9FABA|nr:hypothetical protein [Stylosanthes scabra]
MTLEDIGMILGLPIDGRVVTGLTVGDWNDICARLLGVIPPRDHMRGARLCPDHSGKFMHLMGCIQQATPLVAPLTSTSDYMKWYRRITRRWIGRSSATLGQVVDMVEQLHISSSAPSPNYIFASVHHATTDILEALGEHDNILDQQISQPAPPSQTLVQPPPEEVEQGSGRARRRRTGLAANRSRLRDDNPSSSSSHGTQSSTLAPTGSPPQPPQQHFPQHPFYYPGYLVYPIPPLHTGATGSSSSSTVVPPFPHHFPFPYPYPPISFHRRHQHLETEAPKRPAHATWEALLGYAPPREWRLLMLTYKDISQFP